MGSNPAMRNARSAPCLSGWGERGGRLPILARPPARDSNMPYPTVASPAAPDTPAPLPLTHALAMAGRPARGCARSGRAAGARLRPSGGRGGTDVITNGLWSQSGAYKLTWQLHAICFIAKKIRCTKHHVVNNHLINMSNTVIRSRD
jgi:hypothetical protein